VLEFPSIFFKSLPHPAMTATAAPADSDVLPELAPEELRRYARHLSIPEVGVEGQRRLRAAKVLCIGAGGLGSPVSLYLAAAGIGEIGLVDFDTVDFSNLQRQILYGTEDVGRSKTEVAAERLAAINPGTRVTRYEQRLTSENALAIAEPYDLIIDGTDNFQTRYLSNDLAVLTGKPNVYGSIFRFEGQVSVFAPHLGGPCYRCLFPVPPEPGSVPSCAEGGVLGVLPGIVGCLQVNEAIKLILGIGEPLVGRLVHFDALSFRFREIRLRRDPRCAACGESPTLRSLEDLEFSCEAAAGGGSDAPADGEIDVRELKRRFDAGEQFLLLDVRETHEFAIASLPGARLLPLGELAARLGELERDAEIVVHCKSGGRSARALALLREAGFGKTVHVRGGIEAWAKEIDPTVPTY